MTRPTEPFPGTAERLVLRWVRAYTRALPDPVARDREAELTADLWDQRAEGRWHHRPATTVGAAILSRALRGIPGDLSWRHDQLREALGGEPSRSGVRFGAAWTRRGSVVVASTIGILTLAAVVIAGARLLLHPDTADLVTGTTRLSLVVGLLVVQCGITLLRRAHTRWLAALWLGFGCVVALRSSADAVFGVSVTARRFAVPSLEPLVAVALGSLGVFFVVLAVGWALPARTRAVAPESRSDG